MVMRGSANLFEQYAKEHNAVGPRDIGSLTGAELV